MKTETKKRIRIIAVFAILAIVLVTAFFLNIFTGSIKISMQEVYNIIFLKDESNSAAYNIIWKIRLPRMLIAAVLGGALALSGFLLQTFFRNPIAGPFVLGISSGAKMVLAFVTIAMTGVMAKGSSGFRVPVSVTVIAAFAGSMVSMLVVLLFAGKIRNMSTLLVIGIMISHICSSITDFLINFAKEADIVNLTHWSLGSFSGATWVNVKAAAWIVLPTAFLTILFAKPVSAYSLGEGYAQSMGVRVGFFRVVLIVLSSVLSAAVTAFAGPISFVGIAVPHITRMMLGTDKAQMMIPAVFLCGSGFCMLCDLTARMVFAPTELSIGTVTGAVGAPIVIWLMLSRRKRDGGE